MAHVLVRLRMAQKNPAVLWIAPVGFVIGSLLALAFRPASWSGDYRGALVILSLFASSLALVLHGLVVKRERMQSAAHEISQIEDLRFLGALIELLPLANEFMFGAEMRDTLIYLLHQVQPCDAYRLNRRHRELLHRGLTTRNPPLVLAILHAFEQVGTAEVLPNVQGLAEGKWAAARNTRVREAAQLCLMVLQERIDLINSRQGLLRPSMALGTPADTLLRSVSCLATADSAQLLRADSD